MNKLQNQLGKDKIKYKKDIAPYITLRTKTIAEYYFEAEVKEDIINAVKSSYSLSVPLLILGGGSNLAITKDCIEGLVVKNLYQKKEKIDETEEYIDMVISSGYIVTKLAVETTREGLSGFEYQMGLPGTVGGAIAMNSNWPRDNKYVSDTLISATILDRNGNVKNVDRDYFNFRYDYSILKDTKEIFLEGIFRLKRGDKEKLMGIAKEVSEYRKQTQPYGVATAGCFFQNISEEDKKRLQISTTSAGYLIDKAGLKNKQVGSFIVSDKHANFIVNKGDGIPQDLHTLLDIIKSEVKKKWGVELKEEVIII